jgi:hypothetical protein
MFYALFNGTCLVESANTLFHKKHAMKKVQELRTSFN